MSTQDNSSDRVWDKFNRLLRSEFQTEDKINPLHKSPQEINQFLEESLIKEDPKKISSEKHICNEFNKSFDEDENSL